MAPRIDDKEALGDENAFGEFVPLPTGGSSGIVAASPTAARAAKSLRERASIWASDRGFTIIDSRIVATLDAVDVTVPLYSLTPGTAVMQTRPLANLGGTLVVEPSKWSHRTFAFLHRSRRMTGDAAFDHAFHVEASDAVLAVRLVDEHVRAAIRSCPVWCRAQLSDETIELRLDALALNGEALLGGMRIVAALARASADRTAYR